MALKGVALGLLFAAVGSQAAAGEADVLGASFVRQDNGDYRFQVTVRHDDAGWDHYADRWEIVGPDGAVLATRILQHPHDNEQPFTRSLGGVTLPADIDHVVIRARDSVHGFGGQEVRLSLER